MAQQDSPLPVAYFLRIPNVGDRINPSLISALTGRDVRHIADRTAPHLLAIGSMMHSATPMSQVWGTGQSIPISALARRAAGISTLFVVG